ncbi:MAG: matrixin family metalloprotease, partial [Bdellovibrionota bacterium]
TTGEAPEEGRILHFSRHKNGNIFSLLAYGTDKDGRTLNAIYFAKKFNPQIPTRTAKPYFYLMGPGYKYNWKEKQLTIDVCGEHDEFVEDHTVHAINEWNSALGKKMKIEFGLPKKFYPFSDFNQHCIYIVDNILSKADPRRANYGTTYTIENSEKSELIDSDIFIFKKEFEKNGYSFDAAELRQEMRFTFVHEIGHFLGLDHVFEDGVKSIMGYDFDLEPKLQPIDKEAIRALYE